jgi:2-(1,2-epoxy-1,2-dihydrophenyl)acetyl-CoA isomerase
MTSDSPLRIHDTDEGVRTVTLHRPERLNAVNPLLADALPAAMHEAAANDAVRVVVITGAGRGFCAGLDLAEPVSLGTTRHETLDPYYWVGRWVQSVTSVVSQKFTSTNTAGVAYLQ